MDTGRLVRGFAWGMTATIAMSVVMLLGAITGISPMPKPIPVAIVGTVVGDRAPMPIIFLLAIIVHLAYGGVWGAIFAALIRPVTIGKGLGLGVFLWVVMQVLVLPWLGWGLFGAAITLRIAGATLLLHLIYGATFGWLIDRAMNAPRPHADTFAAR